MRHRIFIIILFISIVFSICQPSLSATQSKNILIFDIPRLTLEDITPQYPNLYRFVKNGAVGIMTTPLSEPVALDQIYFSFNSGTQVKAAEENYLLFDVNEKYRQVAVGDLYHSLTGYRAGTTGVVNIALAKIIQLNSRDITQNIGLFGELLHRHSLKTAAIGNADADLISRCGALLLMDQKGQLDYGDIGSKSLNNDPSFPFGLRTDTNQVFNTWRDFHQKASAVAVTLGDLERLERFSLYLSELQRERFRKQVIHQYDRLLGQFFQEIDFHTTLTMLFTAQPPLQNIGAGQRLSPVVLKGPGFKGGILYSPSTRKKGIITCYDLPITMLHYLNIPKSRYFSGHVLRRVPGDWHLIRSEQQQLIQNYNIRWPLLTTYSYLLIGLILIGIIGAFFWPKQLKLLQYLAQVYLYLITIPVVFLIEAMINPLNWFAVLGWTLGLATLVWVMVRYWAHGSPLLVLSGISLLTIAVILFDGFFNGILELRSFFGYSAIAGARFYGVGNEYMGFLLGAVIVTVSIYLSKMNRYRNQILWLLTGFLAIFLAHPNLGSSIGGGATALIGLGITTYLWLRRPIRWKEIVGLIVAAVFLLVLVGLWDYFLNNTNMTHFGQFLEVIRSQGFDTIVNLIQRKLELNIRLIAYTFWTKVLILILLAIPFLYKKPPLPVARFIQKYPNQTRGFYGLTLSAIIALLINDSGIVTVTTMYIFGLPMLLLLIIEDLSAKKGDEPDGDS
ncbi:MAG TPA: hypothetical protein DDW50_00515 [Firmicutes bacterium]|nr:hypothetical protein [Bacillota bacterium]